MAASLVACWTLPFRQGFEIHGEGHLLRQEGSSPLVAGQDVGQDGPKGHQQEAQDVGQDAFGHEGTVAVTAGGEKASENSRCPQNKPVSPRSTLTVTTLGQGLAGAENSAPHVEHPGRNGQPLSAFSKIEMASVGDGGTGGLSVTYNALFQSWKSPRRERRDPQASHCLHSGHT